MNRIILFLLMAFISCSKDKDPGFTSPEGSWTYATPDSKIIVTFEVIKSGPEFDIKNQTIKVNDVLYNAEKEVTSFTATTIQKIRINANDSKAVYPYDIIFNNGSVSGDFKQINVPTAAYVYPWGKTNNLTDVMIVRM